MTPTWLRLARERVGTAEVPGPGVNAWIKNMWLGLRGGAWYWRAHRSDDSVLPWCGGFCAWAMQGAKFDYPQHYASARAWLEWGQPCGPELGAVAVLWRTGGGHVGFVDATSLDGGHVRLVGGNQGDAVSRAWFPVDRMLGYRKPAFTELTAAAALPVGALSQTEA